MPSILIVDEQKESHELLNTLLEPMGHKITFVSGEERALSLYKNEAFDIVVADNSAPMSSQNNFIKRLKSVDPEAIVIMTDAVPDVPKTIAAMRTNVFDYIKKPLKVSEFVQAINRGLELKYPTAASTARNAGKGNGKGNGSDHHCMALVGNNPLVTAAREQIDKIISERKATAISIQGPQGSGKRYVVEYIHSRLGASADKLATVDCSKISPAQAKEMLIGADGRGGTLVKQAHGGTLAMSQINALPVDVQKAFVGVLQKLGNQTLVVVTCDDNLEDALLDDSFSMELYYHITIEVITLPDISERMEDIAAIVRDIVRYSPEIDESYRKVEFSDTAIAQLKKMKASHNLSELVRMVADCVAYAVKGKVTEKEISIILG
ncbi:MAG: sigma 54-interacting transcriptional regulator [Verrucomicrobiota bacterium]|nr:sigma 54-interacting transcriptional regulator [Verrucomicrobiota bacterium]